MTGSGHPDGWQSRLDVRVGGFAMMEVDKRRNLKLKFEIASYLGRTTCMMAVNDS